MALITGPALVAAIVKNEESVGQWRTVLCILGGIMFVVSFSNKYFENNDIQKKLTIVRFFNSN